MVVVIETNIPAPDKNDTWKAILDSIEVGQSFLIKKSDRNNVAKTISSHFHKFTKKKFKTSNKKETDKLNVRVWRIADEVDEKVN